MEELLKPIVEALEKEFGDLDLDNNKYVVALQNGPAEIWAENNEDGERALKVEIHDREVKYLKADIKSEILPD